MANEPNITVVGNLTADPELRFTPPGAAVANFTIASTPRVFNKQTNQHEDGETLFMRCSVWREQAENVAESIQKGMRVIATGALKSRSFQTREGDNRTVMELDVQEVGPALRFATAQVQRQQRGGGQQGGYQQRPPQGQQRPQQGPPQGYQQPPQQGGYQPQNDPWGGQQGQGQSGQGRYDWGPAQDDQPPF